MVASVRATLGSLGYDQHVAEGECMDPADAVDYACHQVERARRHLSA
jgi:hypothetical protein